MLYIKQNMFYYQIRLKLFVIIFHTALSNFFFIVFSVSLSFSCMLHVPMSTIRAHASPSTLPSCGPYSASLSPSNLPGACGWLLPFRQCPLISGWLAWGDFHVLCVFQSSPSSLLCWCCWLKHAGEALLSKSIGWDSRSLSRRQHRVSEQENLERVESS